MQIITFPPASGTSGGEVGDWGTIGGTLSNQLDLQAALNSKLATTELGTSVQPYSATLSATTAAYLIEDKNKLDGIEIGATADQTAEEVEALYEGLADTNKYTDAEKSKLSGIEGGATADQTGTEIKALYEAEANTNAYVDVDKAKVDNISLSNPINLDSVANTLNELETVHTDSNEPSGFVRDNQDTMGVVEYYDGTNLHRFEEDGTYSELTGQTTYFDGTTALVANAWALSPNTADVKVYADGKPFVLTTTAVSAPHDMGTSGLKFCYFDSATGLTASDVFDANYFEDRAIVSVIYWNAEANEAILIADERHGIHMDGTTHRYLHFIEGTRYESGFTPTDFIDGTTSYTNIEAGVAYDEDITMNIIAQTSMPFIYKNANDVWTQIEDSTSYALIDGTAEYVDNGVLTPITGNDIGITFFILTNDGKFPIKKFLADTLYGSLNDARDDALNALSRLRTEGLPSPEFMPICAVFYNRDGELETLSDGSTFVDYRGVRKSAIGGSSATSTSLSGLLDTDVTGVTTDSVLYNNGADWVVDNTIKPKADLITVTKDINLDEIALASKISGNNVLIDGCEVTINANGTTFDVSSGSFYIVDNYTDPANPVYNYYEFAGATGVTPAYVGTQLASYIAFDTSGSLVQLDHFPARGEDLRDYLAIGVAVHPTGTTITSVSNAVNGTYAGLGTTVFEMGAAIGRITSGNIFSPAGTDLTIRKSTGETFGVAASYKEDKKNPNYTIDPELDPVTFSYYYRDGANDWTIIPNQTNIDPANYDNGTGTPIPVSNNKWTIPKVFYAAGSGTVVVEYGQKVYDSLTSAIESIGIDTTEDAPITENLLFRGWILVQGDCTDLSGVKAQFLTANKFGDTSSVSGGVGLTTVSLQQGYVNSSEPEITTDSTRGAVTVKGGTGDDTDKNISIQNNAGTETAYISADGNASFANIYNKTESDANISTAVSNLVDSSPDTLDTLNELASALGDDPNFATTVANAIGTKVSKVTSTDNAIVRFNGTTGEVQNSGVTIDDDDTLTIEQNDNTSVGQANFKNTSTGTNSFQAIRFEGDARQWKIGSTNSTYTSLPDTANKLFVFEESTGTMAMVIDDTGKVEIPNLDATTAAVGNITDLEVEINNKVASSRPELVTNGTFDTDISGVTNTTGTVVWDSTGGGRISLVGDGAVGGVGYIAINLLEGVTYLASIDFVSGGGNFTASILDAIPGNTIFSFTQDSITSFNVPSSGTYYIRLATGSAVPTEFSYYDNVSVKQLDTVDNLKVNESLLVETGDLSIGTTTNIAKFGIENNLASDTAGTGGILIRNSTRNSALKMYTNGDTKSHSVIQSTDFGNNVNTEGGTANSSFNLLLNPYGGFVAVGQTTALRPLDVLATLINTSARFETDRTTGSFISFNDANTTAELKVRVGALGDELKLYAGGFDRVTVKEDGTLNIKTDTYADDTAAGAGGLVAGDIYKTATGELRIKL